MQLNINKKSVIPLLVLLLISSGCLLWFKGLQKPGLEINCATILHYDHADPDFLTTLELTFRLDRDYEGLVILSGIIKTRTGEQAISRNIMFDYAIKTPGEIVVQNMKYVKTQRDTADDEYLMKGFFYVPEGAKRQLRLNPLNNAWLIGNPQSPVALCVNKIN